MAVGHHLYTLLEAVIANHRLREPLRSELTDRSNAKAAQFSIGQAVMMREKR